MALIAYRLRPRGAMHIGTGREGDMAEIESLPRSDTLAAAMLSLWSRVPPYESNDQVASLAAAPPFALSSALPTVRVGERWEPLLFAPLGLFDKLVATKPELRKTYKKIRFAPAEAIRQLLSGAAPTSFRPAGEALVPQAFSAADLWQRESRLRLEVNRAGDTRMEGRLYDFGAIRFREDVNLTVLAELSDSSVRPRFEAVLRLLGDEGLGGDRSAGYGGFEVVAATEYRPPDLGKGARLVLSLLHPSKEEVGAGLLEPPASYLLVRRGGWVAARGAEGLRRKSLTMLAEGSVVRELDRSGYGDSPCVLEPAASPHLRHPVHRPGLAVTIPIAPPGGLV